MGGGWPDQTRREDIYLQSLLNRQGASPLLNFGDRHLWSFEGVVAHYLIIFVFGRLPVN